MQTYLLNSHYSVKRMKQVKTYFISVLIISFCLTAATAQAQKKSIRGSKNIATETRESRDFNSLEVNKGIVVLLKKGRAKIEIEAEDNLIEYIVTEVNGNSMRVDVAPNVALVDIQPIIVSIFAETHDLRDITISSGGSIAEGSIERDSLSCHLSGGSRLTSNITSHTLLLNVQGDSEATLSGAVDIAAIEVTGASELSGKDLSVQRCTIIAEGNSEARVRVTKEISASASGNSKIKYYGRPKVLEKNTSGRSSVSGK